MLTWPKVQAYWPTDYSYFWQSVYTDYSVIDKTVLL